MVALRILGIRTKDTIVSSLEADLTKIGNDLKSGGSLTFEQPSAEDLTTSLNRIVTLSAMLGAKEITRSKQLLRYFIFLLNSYPT